MSAAILREKDMKRVVVELVDATPARTGDVVSSANAVSGANMENAAAKLAWLLFFPAR
jgi:hypothetical protein